MLGMDVICGEFQVNIQSVLTLPSRLDQMFSDAFSKDHQLIRADPKHSLYLACALMVRGNVQVSDLRRNIERSVHRHRWRVGKPTLTLPNSMTIQHQQPGFMTGAFRCLPASARSPRQPCFHMSGETETEAAVRAHVCAWQWGEEEEGEGWKPQTRRHQKQSSWHSYCIHCTVFFCWLDFVFLIKQMAT